MEDRTHDRALSDHTRRNSAPGLRTRGCGDVPDAVRKRRADALRGFGVGAAIGLLLAGGLTGLGMNLGLGAATDFAVGMALMGLILFLVDGLLALMRTMWRGAIRLSVRVSSRGAAALRGVAGQSAVSRASSSSAPAA